MPYKMVTDVGTLCGRLAGAAFKHRDLIVNTLVDRWRHKLPEGEDFSAIYLFLTLVGEELEEKHQALVASEDELRSELRQDKQDRGIRDDSWSEVRDLLLETKQLIDVHYGPGSVETLFEEDDEEIPTHPDALHRLGVRVRRNLLDPVFPMPPLMVDIGTDLTRHAHRFDQPLEGLGRSVKGLYLGTQGSSASLAVKEDQLLDEQKDAVLAGRLLEAITAYCGHPRVARRIRLSRRRARDRQTTPSDDPTPEAPAEENPAAGGDVASPEPAPNAEEPAENTETNGPEEPENQA